MAATDTVKEDLQALSEREKQTLRLLLVGHDAKSVARELGLSVHTVNERLKAARRKLGVTSSREAARILGGAESQSSGDEHLGVFPPPGSSPDGPATEGPRRAKRRLAWIGGGILTMSALVGAVIFVASLQAGGTPADSAGFAPVPVSETASAAVMPAREWVALLDAGRWEDSWRTAAPVFQSQGAAQWQAIVEPLRQSLGPVRSRVFKSAAKASSLPGAPAGEYELIEFSTRFARRDSAVETVVLARQSGAWKVAGYFIR